MATYARAQDRSPVVTAAQTLVKIISSDPAKVETYCTIGVIGVQIEDANEARDKKTADLLTQKMRGLEKQLGGEYLSLMHGNAVYGIDRPCYGRAVCADRPPQFFQLTRKQTKKEVNSAPRQFQKWVEPDTAYRVFVALLILPFLHLAKSSNARTNLLWTYLPSFTFCAIPRRNGMSKDSMKKDDGMSKDNMKK